MTRADRRADLDGGVSVAEDEDRVGLSGTTAKSNTPDGAVFYMPKLYLLVAQLPYAGGGAGTKTGEADDPTPPPESAGAEQQEGWPAADRGPAPGGADEKSAAGVEATALVAGSDQSFGGSSEGYIPKIVYLPDMSRPMSVSVKARLGPASLKPAFQNGWMLTGFDASADSETADILDALAPLITAYKTPGKEPASDKSGAGAQHTPPRDARPALAPGLYEIRYDDAGRLSGICGKASFTVKGTEPATGLGACR